MSPVQTFSSRRVEMVSAFQLRKHFFDDNLLRSYLCFAPVHCAPWLGSVGAVLLPDKTSGGSLQDCLCIVHRGGGGVIEEGANHAIFLDTFLSHTRSCICNSLHQPSVTVLSEGQEASPCSCCDYAATHSNLDQTNTSTIDANYRSSWVSFVC